MKVSIPWPSRDLSPNARVHYFTLAKRKKAYRTGAYWEATQAFRDHGKPAFVGGVDVLVTFHPPDNRRRDLDNMLASIKAGIDGIAEATSCDDSRWRITISRGEVIHRGLVVVEIRGEVLLPIRGVIS